MPIPSRRAERLPRSVSKIGSDATEDAGGVTVCLVLRYENIGYVLSSEFHTHTHTCQGAKTMERHYANFVFLRIHGYSSECMYVYIYLYPLYVL